MNPHQPKKPKVENLFPILRAELKDDSNVPEASTQSVENAGGNATGENPQPTVSFATISKKPSFQRLRYCQRTPGIGWGINSKYNDYMPYQQLPNNFQSHRSVVSREYKWMDYMASGYESDEYYEADDDSEIEEAPVQDRQRQRRGRRSHYADEAGATPESIVRYYIDNALTHTKSFRKNNEPRPFKPSDYTGNGLTHSDLEKLQSMAISKDRKNNGSEDSDTSY